MKRRVSIMFGRGRSDCASVRTMARRAAAVALALLPWVAMPVPSRADQAAESAPRRPVPLTRETAEQRRGSFENGWPSIEATLKRWRGLNEGPRDFRGVAPAADIKTYVLTAEERKQLDDWRAEAQRQFDGGDWPGAILLYGNLINQANQVIVRMRQVAGYWIWHETHERRMARWHRAVRANDIANSHEDEIETLEASLKERVRARQFEDPTAGVMRDIDALFTRAVTEARAAAPGGVLRDDPMRRMPRRPCADADVDNASSTSSVVKTPPRLDLRNSKPTQNFYPLVARYNGIEGLTTVSVLVAPSGCVVHAEIARTSTSDLLDDAAMEWATDGAKFSGAVNEKGEPVTVKMQFNVRFKLD